MEEPPYEPSGASPEADGRGQYPDGAEAYSGRSGGHAEAYRIRGLPGLQGHRGQARTGRVVR